MQQFMALQNYSDQNSMLRNVASATYRTTRLMDLINKTMPDLSHEVDLDAIDMQDYKFNTNDIVTLLHRKRDEGE